MTAAAPSLEQQLLKPCPFCGPGESIVNTWFDDVAGRYRVGCGRCGASTGISPRDKTEAPAIAAWNTRASLQADHGTPSSRWAANGEPDPHGKQYDCERAALSMGEMTDDELADAVAALQADPVAVDRDALAQLAYETWRDTAIGGFPNDSHHPKWLAVVDAITTPPPTELQADRADRVDVALMTATIDSLRTRLASCETALETAYAESTALQADRGAVSPRAIDALTIYRQQADADGVMVMVSRQALDELLAAYTPQGDVSGAIDGPDYFDGCSLNGYVGGCERMGCHTAAPAAVSAGFGMDDEQVAALLEASLKPEEIGGDAVIRHKRVVELLHWFARLTRGHANPKWTTSHACELAYYIATAPKPTDEAPAKGDDRYLELIYAVGNKYPGESRHETALRYIRQAEQHGDEHACTDATSQDSPT